MKVNTKIPEYIYDIISSDSEYIHINSKYWIFNCYICLFHFLTKNSNGKVFLILI